MARSPRIACAVFLGGCVGALMRHGLAEVLTGGDQPTLIPTLTANLVGAFVLGWFAERVRHAAPWSTAAVAFVGVGVLGSFTTFSAMMVGSVEELRHGAYGGVAAYMVCSMAGGILLARRGRIWAAQRWS